MSSQVGSPPASPHNARTETNMLSCQAKRTECVTWTPYLRDYISNGYAEHPDLYKEDFRALEELRNDCINIEGNEKVLNRLLKYHAQLVFMGSKFPIDVGIEFPWYPVSIDDTPKSASFRNVMYERACVLYCIGSMYSQLGNTENRSSTDGVKKACSIFQYAAGCFKHLQDVVVPGMRISPPADMSPHALQTLIQLMLAQAQECFWQKAAMDQLRDSTIARLAAKVAEYYDAAYEQASNSSIQSVFPKHWHTHMQIKALHFHAATHFRKSCECISQNKYGEEIARLQLANSYVKRASELLRSTPGSFSGISHAVIGDLRSLQQIIQTNLARAEKDNDVIYTVTIPLASDLPPIPTHDMVKPVAPEVASDPASKIQHDTTGTYLIPHSIVGLPLFQKLIPFAVHQAASIYVDRKDRLIKENIIAQLEALNLAYHNALQSLGVSEILAASDQMLRLPEKLTKQSAEIQERGGYDGLESMWKKVLLGSTRNNEILDEAFDALDRAQEQEERMRSQHTEPLNTSAFQKEMDKLVAQGQTHRANLDHAQKSNVIVRTKLDQWSEIIEVLALPQQDLRAFLLDVYNSGDTNNTQASLTQLKQQIEDMAQHLRMRKEVVDQARRMSNADDISPALLRKASQLTSNSPIVNIETAQFEELFGEELQKYNKFTTEVDRENEFQRRALKDITEACRQQASASAKHAKTLQNEKRTKALQNLEYAYQKFKEIQDNLSTALTFYTDHDKSLTVFRGVCNEFCEKEDKAL